MRPIQILVEDALIREMDQEARRQRTDRSKLIRVAVEKYLADLRVASLEERHRAGYIRLPQRKDEVALWERIQQWPEE